MSEYRDRHPGFVVREPYYNRVLPSDANPKLVVDVGSAFDSASWLRERFPNAKLIATNIYPRHLDSVPDEWGEKRLVTAESMGNIEDVDLLFLGEVLEHLVYPQEFLANAVAMLRKGGLILLSTPNLATWHNRLLMLFGYAPSNYSMMPGRHLGLPHRLSRMAGLGYGDHIRVFTYGALRELFSTDPWRLEKIASAPAIDSLRPMHRIRNFIGSIVPPGAREDVFVCARLESKNVVEVASATAFIGSTEKLSG